MQIKTNNNEQSVGVRLGKLTLRDILMQLRMAPNLLSISRLVFLSPVVLLIKYEVKPWSVILLILLWITDYIDGYIARRFRQKTDLGLLLDPVADKITCAALFITLIPKGFPLWIALVVIIRDIIILSAAFYILKRNLMVSSDFIGRITTVLIAVIILLFVLGFKEYGIALSYVLMGLMAVTMVNYGLRFLKLIKQNK